MLQRFFHSLLGCKTFLHVTFSHATFFPNSHIFLSFPVIYQATTSSPKRNFPLTYLWYLLELRMNETLRGIQHRQADSHAHDWFLTVETLSIWSLWWYRSCTIAKETFSPLDTYSIVLNHWNWCQIEAFKDSFWHFYLSLKMLKDFKMPTFFPRSSCHLLTNFDELCTAELTDGSTRTGPGRSNWLFLGGRWPLPYFSVVF